MTRSAGSDLIVALCKAEQPRQALRVYHDMMASAFGSPGKILKAFILLCLKMGNTSDHLGSMKAMRPQLLATVISATSIAHPLIYDSAQAS